jgi:hypothetical protein
VLFQVAELGVIVGARAEVRALLDDDIADGCQREAHSSSRVFVGAANYMAAGRQTHVSITHEEPGELNIATRPAAPRVTRYGDT